MTINELLAAADLTANDELPIWDADAADGEENTKKVTARQLAAAMVIIGNYLTTANLPLPVKSGGSGLDASPSLLVDLASGSAENVMQADPRPGVTGVLGLENGGLGASASSAAEARSNLGAATVLTFDTATWADVYSKLSGLRTNECAPFFVSNAANVSGLLTGGKVASSTMRGVVSKTLNSTTFDFMATSGSANQMLTWRISGLSASSGTVGTVYKYTGTAM